MSDLRCDRCGRPAEQGERLGDTCGARGPQVFEPNPLDITIEELLERGRKAMNPPRCLGTLLKP
jgi:hypothetical protein